jgi:alpha-tubulin suppressor-like RCC1 family protein
MKATLCIALLLLVHVLGGEPFGVGNNQQRQLGDGSMDSKTTPGPVRGAVEGRDISDISAKSNLNCALDSTGAVFSWGSNAKRALGSGSGKSTTESVPVKGLQSISSVSVGGYHGLALSGNTVFAWGSNEFGQTGTEAFTLAGAVIVDSLRDVNIVAISAGYQHSLAVTSDGEVYSWGWNIAGQLGDGTLNSRTTPAVVQALSGVNIIAVVGSSDCESLAISSTGRLYYWGAYDEPSLFPRLAGGLLENVFVVQADAGQESAYAVGSNGKLYAWGSDGSGQVCCFSLLISN